MSTATPDDVTAEIATNLSDSDIQDSLDSAEEWNTAANRPGQQSTVETKNIEKWYAIVHIRQFKERSVSEDATGDASSVFEGDEIERAKAELAKWLSIAGEDPSGASGVIRDSDRHVTSTG